MKIILFLFLTVVVTTVNGQNGGLNIIPQPVESTFQDGVFVVGPSMTIGYSSAAGEHCAQFLAAKLNGATGFTPVVSQGLQGEIRLSLLKKPNPLWGMEGYSLEVTPSAILIAANTPSGLFYGVQTLLQLLPADIESKKVVSRSWPIQCVKIVDYPRFAWRGLMLDVSRHFFPKKDVMALIDQMVQFKYNTLHWHLTDDQGWRIEIKAFPLLTQVGASRVARAGRFGERATPKATEEATDGGFYTQEDIREIVQYAQSRYVTIVPEIDIPGHSMAAIAAYPELSCTKDSTIRVNPGSPFSNWYANNTFKMNVDNTLNPSDEKVYLFLDKVFGEVSALFPGTYIHVGGDECYKGYWKQDEGCKALMKKEKIRHVEDLQGYFMQRVEKILRSKGKTMIGWDEILEGGVSSSAAIMNWRSSDIGAEASMAGHRVVMTPSAFCYLDYCQGDPTVDPPVYSNLRLKTCYDFEPIAKGAKEENILGGQGNLWTENVPNLRQVEYMLYPRAWALAEDFWSPREKRDWKGFIQRVEMQFERADKGEINHSRAIYDATIKLSLKEDGSWLELTAEAPGVDIFYTLDDAMPDNYSPQYSVPFKLPEGPITLRVITYRNGLPIGHMITLNPAEIKRRSKY